MNKINNVLNPNDKLVGNLNAFFQSQKNSKVENDEGKINSIEKNGNNKGVELVLSNGDKTVKVTYTKEELINKLKDIQTEDNQGKTESVIYLDLDLEKIISQESVSNVKSIVTAGSDPYLSNDSNTKEFTAESSNNTINKFTTLGYVKLNPIQISLVTADDLELNLELKVGNDILVVGNNSTVSFNTNIQEDTGEDIFIIGNNSNVNINSNSVIDNSDDIIIVGNNSDVSISSKAGADYGNDTIIIGNHSKVSIDSEVGIDKGSDTVIIGNNSTFVMDSDCKESSGNDTVILGNNSKITYKGSVGKDDGSDIIILGNNSTLNIEGDMDIHGGNSVIILGNNVKLNIKLNIKEDFENSQMFIGTDKEKILKELNELGKKLNKFKFNKISLKDIIDETINQVKEKLMKANKYKHIENLGNSNYSNFNYLNLAMYRYFNRQLSGIELLYSYANKAYTKNK